MLKHIVMWQLNGSDSTTLANHANQIKQRLETLRDEIAEIEKLEVGINSTKDPQAWDVVLISSFKNQQDLKTYATHPAHLEAAAFIKSVTSDRAVVDYIS